MKRSMHGDWDGRPGARAATWALLLLTTTCARADIVTLKNGMQFEGSPGTIASLGEDPLNPRGGGGAVKAKNIVLVDDNLRRTFFSRFQAQPINPKQTNLERIRIEQRVAKGNRRVGAVGPIVQVTPFDEWGRRVFSMNTAQGPVDVIQGITEVTPVYTKVEGLQARTALVWDMRVATSSIPRETLSKVLLHTIDAQDADDRLRVVRLYIQAERFNDARQELESVIQAFPDLADLKKQVQSLQQLSARRLIDEIKLRKEAGQHALAYNMLDRFPSKEVTGETLVQVREMLDEYRALKQQGEDALKSLEQVFDAVPASKVKTDVEPLMAEIKTELNINTFGRLADFRRFAADEKMPAEQKLALAVSGWLIGSGQGTENLTLAASLLEVRTLVLRYLNTAGPLDREQILDDLSSLEGGAPGSLTKLIGNLKPAVDTPVDEDAVPGFFELQVAGLPESPDIAYYVQLPPEYEPHRQYPAIVTLNGAGTTPQQQIDWWAGAYDTQTNLRLGQGARHGYIVIAPQWTKPHQRDYEFSAREHAAVLYSLRDACRRFAIDTDRVFLSGHSMGGDAAWDIALAHPDLWAGVVPIVATADRYIGRYSENGRYVPFYFVAGELDGDKLGRNSIEWDRYLNRANYDSVVVVYEGRGHEHFQDEIHRLFQWMKLHHRNFFPKEYVCNSLRPWDNYFWWAEVEDIPQASQVLPANWPPSGSLQPARIEGHVTEKNRVTVKTGAGRTTVWLSPEMVDFSKHPVVSINGRERSQSIEPSAKVLLEDVRTRGDRQHPFWAKVESSPAR